MRKSNDNRADGGSRIEAVTGIYQQVGRAALAGNEGCEMKPQADFNHVEPHHNAIHERLRNWSRWVVVRPQSKVQPMFRYYRPAQHWHEKEFREPCDLIDAQAVEKLVCGLPHTHAYALKWYYVYRLSVGIARRELGLTVQGVDKAVRDARQMMLMMSVR